MRVEAREANFERAAIFSLRAPAPATSDDSQPRRRRAQNSQSATDEPFCETPVTSPARRRSRSSVSVARSHKSEKIGWSSDDGR